MAARAIWKGSIKIGSKELPVKLYSAVEDRKMRFHILDDRNRTRVKQHMVSPETGDEVPTEEIRRGYEIEPGRYVILDEKDLDSLVPEPSRDITIKEFVPVEAIPQQFYERPYYLAPNGDAKDYFALAEALANQQAEGIAEWVMRNKRYTGALGSQDGYLVLSTLRTANEVISAAKLPAPAGRPPTKKEIEMAKHLVGMLEGEFKAEDYKDEYRERVMEFIEKKAKGRAPKLKPVRAKRQAAALDSMLEKSIAALKKEKRAA